MTAFDPNRLVPIGLHGTVADPRVLDIDDLNPDYLAGYMSDRHGLPGDVARLFVTWLLGDLADWADEDTVLTWGELIASALEQWRGDDTN